MSEQAARSKLYAYKTNANLVLDSGRRGAPVDSNLTGEPDSLWGRLGSTKFGDLAMRHKDQDLSCRLERVKARHEQKRQREDANEVESASLAMNIDPRKGLKHQRRDVLSATKELNASNATTGYRYKPKTRQAKQAFSALSATIQRVMGDITPDVLRGAVYETLSVFKDESMSAEIKTKTIEDLFPEQRTDSTFMDEISRCINKIDDFADDQNLPNDALDEELGVAVVFDDEEEENLNREENIDIDYEIYDEEEDDDDNDEDRELGKAESDVGNSIINNDDQIVSELNNTQNDTTFLF